MATVLSIPSGKKLLRRHLATHFESLVGSACLKVKETALANGFTALIPGEKQKVFWYFYKIKILNEGRGLCLKYLCC